MVWKFQLYLLTFSSLPATVLRHITSCYVKTVVQYILHFILYIYIYTYIIHPFIVPWVHHPLVSSARVTIIFHTSLSCAFLFSINISSSHHSFTSSSHSLFGRPLFVFPFISLNTTSFTSLLSSILQMPPN